MTTLSGLASSLLALVAFLAVVWVGLRVAQSIFGTQTKKAAATEVAAKLVAYPTGSRGVLRRRFVRALTGQHVIMPSGERHAYSELTVRVAPEDLERLDPDSDTERLGADAARLYLAHAKREGWKTGGDVTVHVEVDHTLRSGWVPPARGTGRADATGAGLGWDVVRDDAPRPAPVPLQVVPPSSPASVLDLDATQGFDAIGTQPVAGPPTVATTGELHLEHDGDVTVVPRDATRTFVLGRLPGSVVRLAQPEVSYRHAAIRLRAGRWQLKDLGSTNGTTVDGTAVEPEAWTVLADGSVIELAGVRLVATTDTRGTVHRAGVAARR